MDYLKHGITILYHLHQCRPSYREIFRVEVGKGGIKCLSQGHSTVTLPAVSPELATLRYQE